MLSVSRRTRRPRFHRTTGATFTSRRIRIAISCTFKSRALFLKVQENYRDSDPRSLPLVAARRSNTDEGVQYAEIFAKEADRPHICSDRCHLYYLHYGLHCSG